MKHKGLFVVITVVLAVCQLILLPLTNLEKLVFDEAYYAQHYTDEGVYETVNITPGDLHIVTQNLMDYLRGDRKTLQTLVSIDGKLQPFFNERELLHMLDVRELFEAGFAIKNGALVVFVAILVILFFMKKGKYIIRGLFYSSLSVFLLLVGLGFVVNTNFVFWFVEFHQVCFDNDLWMLNPERDNLLKMFPQDFFAHTVYTVLVDTLKQLGSVAAVTWLLSKPLLRFHLPFK